MTKNVGRGKRVRLRCVQDLDGKVHHNKEKMEQKLRYYNRMHFSKVKDSIACKDKIHTNLTDDDVRKKIMQGTLNR